MPTASPHLAILMQTYNHEAYIAQAIEGVLRQKTSFARRLYIFDDCSTDNTFQICTSYQARHPDLIHASRNATNIGPHRTYEVVLRIGIESHARYIAFCEGDDYWTDPSKVERQVMLLEADSGCAFSFHRVHELDNDGLTLSRLVPPGEKPSYTQVDLARGNFIHTTSAVFRNHLDRLPSWISTSPVCDYPMHMFSASGGKLSYLPEPMAVYRRHAAGTWSTQSQASRDGQWLTVLDLLLTAGFGEDVNIELRKQRRETVYRYLTLSLRNDPDEFIGAMQRVRALDSGMAADWLLDAYPAMVGEIRQSRHSRAYAWARRLGRLNDKARRRLFGTRT